MNTSTPPRIFRFAFPITAIIILVLLAFTHPSITATASDARLLPTPSAVPDSTVEPSPTPLPTIWITPTPSLYPTITPTIWVSPTPSHYPIITPTPTPILDITPTFTPSPTVTATPEPTDPPDIEISPTSFEVTLREGETRTENLTLQNVGASILTFSITTSSTTTMPQNSLGFPTTKIEAGLIEQIQNSSDQQATFIVYLTTQADLNAAYQIQDWALRGDLVFHTLLETAQETQADLISYLENQRISGAVSSYRPFYIVNAISVTAGLETLNDLAARPDVAYIEAEKIFHIPDPIPADDLSTDAVEWGVSKIRADQVWSEFDIYGDGAVVANIDTGVLHTHPALINNYRGNMSGSHDYNWFDPRGASTPFDNNGHGTHTMGTMVGSDGGSNRIGVAPSAKWIAAKGCYSSYCTETDLLASAEWVLAPYPYGGSPSQGVPSMRPNVVNNSWGGWGGDLWFQASVNAWRAASIFPAFSAGNSGPGSGTVGSPGDYAESFASGATDSSDVIASFSSRGPSSLTNETKPDVSAPGVNVRSSYNNGDYYTASGTSMASPHTAGCVALVLSAAPNLDLISIENLLTSTAVDLGASGPDDTYGYGRIDCYAAVSTARDVGVPWLTVNPKAGSVTPMDSQTIAFTFDASNLIAGQYGAIATIHSNDPDENPLDVPITLHVTAAEPDIEISPAAFQAILPVGGSAETNLNIANNGDATLNFELEVFTSNVAQVPQGGPDGFGYSFADSDQSGGPTFDWIDISDSGNQLSLSDDSYFFPIDLPFNFNFYGTDYNQVAVASNGTIYFQDDYLGLSNTSIPSRNNYGPQVFIAVYWDDLNPSANGAIYYEFVGSAPNRKLIIQYQEVAHYGNSFDTITAQAILLEGSNSILVQYLDPSSEAGSGATEGIQGDPNPDVNWGLQYGYNQSLLSENLAICYAYPEMPLDCSSGSPTPSWLSVDPVDGSVDPETTQVVFVSLNAVHLIPGNYSGSIIIHSNDPDENPITVPVSLRVTDEEPDIEISPDSFEVSLPAGTATEENLSIANVGGDTLNFELDVSTSNIAPEEQSGPDGFGYAFADSDQSGGPTFDWIDISDSGNQLSLSDDSYFFPIDLPFNFNFYGTDYDQVAVGSNGTVYFQDAYLGLSNSSIPSRNNYTPQTFIAVYWDDLNPSANGDIYYQILGAEPDRKLVVQYQDVAHYGTSSDTVTAQAILLEGSNSILVQYLDPSNEAGSGATEGIQGDPNPQTNWGLQYGYNEAVLTANLAICYAYPDMPLDCSSSGPTPSWLSVAPTEGAVEPQASQDVIVSLDATDLNPGTYSGSITVNSNDPDENPLTVPVILNVTAPEPDIEITPTSFELTLLQGQEAAEILSMGNIGGSDLTFELEASIADPIPNPPGGPDGFGYTFIDSNDFGGPPFNWIDISTSGTRLFLQDDTFAFPINLPFNFNFYGTDCSQVAVSANGAIYFQNVPLNYINYPIPTNSSSSPRSFIAVYWDDLNPITGSAVYYQILGSEPDRKFIVQWQQVAHYGSTSDFVTAQVILLEGSDSILVQYLDPSNEAGSGATVGIQGDPDPDVNWGLQYGYNQAVLSKNLAICYAYPDSYPNCVGPAAPWLSVDPQSGSVRPKETRNIDVHIDASDLKLGEHLGAITVQSNDPDEDLLVVPVTLNVTAPDPDIEVSPTSFDVALPSGETQVENLTISNVGDADLSFQVSVDTSTPVGWQPLSFPVNKVDPELRNIDLFAANSHATFLVYLNRQADLASAFQVQDRTARGDLVFQTLQNTAQRTQASLILYLENQRISGDVSSYRPFYIVNAISVTAGLETLNDLAARPDVAYIEAEKVFRIPDPIPAGDLSTDAVEWGVSKIRANQVWADFNLRGEGVVVANIDTGVQYNHSALVDQYRGTSTGSHDYNWFDPRGASTPFDNNGHGTHTMGTMVGSDGGSNQIGVAPAAQWIAAKGCYSSSCTESDLLASAEWILAPYPYGGSPSQGDPNMRPHVVNNSWGGGGGDLWYQASVNAWRAADIFPAFSAGNSGPSYGTVGSPGDYAESFASGATDSGDAIAYFSSRGPSSLTTETKPDVSAPGVSVRSAYNNGGYTSLSGTSMASPHTAGCVALILSAAPGLDLVRIEDLLTSTAVDLGASGPDHTYGYGRIDCYTAVSEVGSTWIRVTPTSGEVQPGSAQILTVTFDSAGLNPGTYAATIEIRSNDPDEGLVRVSVTLTVTNYVD
jgi:subtilisin family serine protease